MVGERHKGGCLEQECASEKGRCESRGAALEFGWRQEIAKRPMDVFIFDLELPLNISSQCAVSVGSEEDSSD